MFAPYPLQYVGRGQGNLEKKRKPYQPGTDVLYFVETDGCTIKDLERFDHLPYKNKVALTHKAYPQIKCAYYIKGYENQDGVTGLYYFRKILPLRIYDQFNWMRFLKRGKI